MGFTGFGDSRGGGNGINMGGNNMASGNPSAANHDGGRNANGINMGGGRGAGEGNMGNNAKVDSGYKSNVSLSNDQSASKQSPMATLRSVMQTRVSNTMTPGVAPGQASFTDSVSGKEEKGYTNDTIGTVPNSVGAMNTPEAQAKAAQMQRSFQTGHRERTDEMTTRGVFGSLPGVGGLVGYGVGRLAKTSPTSEDDQSARMAGEAYSDQAGMGSGMMAAAQQAAGFAGPVGSIAGGLLTTAYDRNQRVNSLPSAYDSANPDVAAQRANTAANLAAAQAQGPSSSGSVRDMIMGMLQGANPLEGYTVTSVAPQPASTIPQSFQMAGDYSQQRNAGLQNLGDIINQGRRY